MTVVALTVPTVPIRVLILLVVVTAVMLMLPLVMRAVGTRLAEIVVITRLNGLPIVEVLIVPLVRALVNIGILEPLGMTSKVPPLKEHVGAQLPEMLAPTTRKVFVLPTRLTLKGLVKLPVIVPLTKFPLFKLILPANAAVGKPRAKSAKKSAGLMFCSFYWICHLNKVGKE